MAKVGGFFREPFLFNGELISAFGIIIIDNGPPGSGQPDTVHPSSSSSASTRSRRTGPATSSGPLAI
jgi:hypothetical protein